MYGGALGTRVAEGLAELGGYLTPADMAAMEVRWIEPLSVDYKGWTLWELPPAGQGIAALQMLGLLEPFDLAGMGHNSPEYLHHLIEAKKVAFADLARHVADADHMEIDPRELIKPDYLAARRALINPTLAAKALFGALDEMATNWILSTRRYDLAGEADAVVDLFVNGLAT